MNTWNGPNVRHLRLRLGWTQPELGRRLGLTVEQVQSLESSQLNVDIEITHQLDYLKSSIDELSETVKQRPLVEKTLKEKKIHQIDKFEL